MFTFKTEKPTGKWRSFYPDSHHIKIKKSKVGNISDKYPHKISLAVFKEDINEDGNPNCEWKWIQLKKESKSLSEAKEWLKSNYDLLIKKYRLYPLS